jgi:hypothetical protein
MKSLDRLYCDAVTVSAIPFDFSEGYTERWDIVYPEPKDWTLAQCKKWLDDIGYHYPEPNPWGMDRDQMTSLLNEISIEVYDHESDEVLRQAVVANLDDETLDGLDDWRECVRDKMPDQADRYTPMMNYLYPLPDFRMDPSKAQALLDTEGGAVCVVDVGGETYMALTGGGMDMSWDIAHGYMLLGYYPPLDYCNLPDFAGQRASEKNLWIVQGCLRSCEIARSTAKNRIEHLRQLKKNLK